MCSVEIPIACNLNALSAEQRSREQHLLASFRGSVDEPQETETGFCFLLREDPELLARLGEFLALERLCCPFLNFELLVPAAREPVSLRIFGGPGVKSFIRSTFAG